MLTSSGRCIASLAPRGPAGSVAIVRGAPILLCLRHLADAFDRPSGHTGRKPMRRRTHVFIGVLAVVLIGGVALGVRNLSDAFADRPDGSSQRVTANGWVAYVVALTDWNTPGGPEFESPAGPTRIALVHPADPSPRYVGEVSPPQPGESLDDWLSVRQQCPTMSPDGGRLAFLERKPQGISGSGVNLGTIVIVGLDDQGRSTGEELRAKGGCPTWSPDGLHVAFVDPALGSITIVDLDGSRRSSPPPTRDGRLVSLAWSPDGTAIAAIDLSTSGSPHGDLWLTPVNGGRPSLLYAGDTPMPMQGKPAWSPDSTQIAITVATAPAPTPDADGAIPDVPQEWAVLVVPVGEEGQVREVGRGIAPAWSPTGDRLAYLANPSDGGPAAVGDIIVVKPAEGEGDAIPAAPIAPGTALSDYSSEGVRGAVWRAHPPIWSPDGSKLLFIGSDGWWGTSVLLSVSPTGNEEPRPMSETWVAEWYGQDPISWGSVDAPE